MKRSNVRKMAVLYQRDGSPGTCKPFHFEKVCRQFFSSAIYAIIGRRFHEPRLYQGDRGLQRCGDEAQSADQFEPMLRGALSRDVPVIIDMPIDYSENDLIYKLL